MFKTRRFSVFRAKNLRVFFFYLKNIRIINETNGINFRLEIQKLRGFITTQISSSDSVPAKFL